MASAAPAAPAAPAPAAPAPDWTSAAVLLSRRMGGGATVQYVFRTGDEWGLTEHPERGNVLLLDTAFVENKGDAPLFAKSITAKRGDVSGTFRWYPAARAWVQCGQPGKGGVLAAGSKATGKMMTSIREMVSGERQQRDVKATVAEERRKREEAEEESAALMMDLDIVTEQFADVESCANNASRAMGKVVRDVGRLRRGRHEHEHTDDTREAIRLAQMPGVGVVRVAPSVTSASSDSSHTTGGAPSRGGDLDKQLQQLTVVEEDEMDYRFGLALLSSTLGPLDVDLRSTDKEFKRREPGETRSIVQQIYGDKSPIDAMEQALSESQIAFGDEHRITLACMASLGNKKRIEHDLVAAATLLEEAVVGLRRTSGAGDTLTLQAMFDLGRLKVSQGDLVAAGKLLEEALVGFRHTLGDKDRATTSVLHDLILVRKALMQHK